MRKFTISSDHEPNLNANYCTKLQFEAEFYCKPSGVVNFEFDGQVLNLSTGIVKHISELCTADQEAIESALDEYALEYDGIRAERA